MIKGKPRIYANDSRLVSALQDAFSIGMWREWLESRPMVFVGVGVYAVTDLVVISDDLTNINGCLWFSIDLNSQLGRFGSYRNGLMFTLKRHQLH